jgi:hypothetical protein
MARNRVTNPSEILNQCLEATHEGERGSVKSPQGLEGEGSKVKTCSEALQEGSVGVILALSRQRGRGPWSESGE